MDDLLTTRQLQELLQVDRVTIYRMLSDGRLTGFKVGGQWRFSRQEIEKWLQAQRATLEAADLTDELPFSSDVLALSCVQAIQSIFAEALDVAAVTTDPDGNPLTGVCNSCRFCDLVLSVAEGRRRCAESWGLLRDEPSFSPSVYSCHAGLLVAGAPIKVGGKWVGNVVSCQFVTHSPKELGRAWLATLPVLAAELGLAESDLEAVAGSVRALSQEQLDRILRLLLLVADALAEIGQERLKLVNRLRRIAEMTNV